MVYNIRFVVPAYVLMGTSEELEEFGLTLTEMLTEPDEYAEVSGVTEDENMPGEVKGAEEGMLAASGLTECVGIAVYDESNDVGYVGHIVTRGNQDISGDLQDFNTLMIEESVDFENSIIHFGGLDYDLGVSDRFLDDEGELASVKAEGALRRMFEKYGEKTFGAVETSWGYEGERGGQLILDSNNGEIIYNPNWASSEEPASYEDVASDYPQTANHL